MFILAKEDKSDTVGKPMACIDMPGEIDLVMVEIGLVAVSCEGRNTVMLVRSVITLLAAGATKSLLPTGLALSGRTAKHDNSETNYICTTY